MALPYATEDQLRQLKTQLANVGNKSVKTKEELDALKGTDGQLVYCQEDSKLYIFKKDKWEEVGSDSVGKKVGYVELDAEQSRAFLANDSSNFGLTESQIDTVINNDIIKLTFSRTIGSDETAKFTLDFFKQLYSASADTMSVTYHIIYGTFEDTIKILMVGKVGEDSMVVLSQIQSAVPCTSSDNGKVLKVVNGEAQWSTLYFTEDKTISFLGNHNILVPRNSTDTSILPCTASDNGKVLSVVNGQAQWAKANVGDTIDNTSPAISGLGRITIKVGHYTVGQKLSISVNIPYNENHLKIPATAHGKEVITADDVVFLTSFSFDGDNKLMYANLICIKEGDVATERTPLIYGAFYPITKSN